MSRWNRLDGVIINHGTLDPVKKVADSSAEEWRKSFDINVFSALSIVSVSVLKSQYALPLTRCIAFGSIPAAFPPLIYEELFPLTLSQISPAIPHLRRTHGRIILTSSGASLNAYQGWGAYGAGKAVLNHLALTLAVEEPDITTISVRPGVVDTEMQREIREKHKETMSAKDAEKFAGLKKEGGLLRPEQPGYVIAKLAVGAGKEFSGKFLNWNDESLGDFQGE